VDGRAMDAPSELVIGGEHARMWNTKPPISMNTMDAIGRMERTREFSTVKPDCLQASLLLLLSPGPRSACPG
jgi:hypothetical protein